MKVKIIAFLILFSCVGFAQEIESIQADRPDQTETPFLTPKGMFQIETGFSFQKNDANSSSNLLPSSLWKYGVNENFELRLITEFANEKTNNDNLYGFNPVLIGCKIKISEEKGCFPKTSFIGHISLPNAASTIFKTDYFAPEFRFLMQHTLSKKMSFSYNFGVEWNGFTPEPTFIYTVTTGYALTEKLGCYAEFFGFAPQINSANHNFDTGFTYLINNNFMIDVSSGVGITKNAPDHYVAFGFSIRK